MFVIGYILVVYNCRTFLFLEYFHGENKFILYSIFVLDRCFIMKLNYSKNSQLYKDSG